MLDGNKVRNMTWRGNPVDSVVEPAPMARLGEIAFFEGNVVSKFGSVGREVPIHSFQTMARGPMSNFFNLH